MNFCKKRDKNEKAVQKLPCNEANRQFAKNTRNNLLIVHLIQRNTFFFVNLDLNLPQDIQILSPVKATQFTLKRMKRPDRAEGI